VIVFWVVLLLVQEQPFWLPQRTYVYPLKHYFGSNNTLTIGTGFCNCNLKFYYGGNRITGNSNLKKGMTVTKAEVALLVLTYLKDEKFKETFEAFQKECNLITKLTPQTVRHRDSICL
jgi:hypothetical protein